MTGRWRTRKVSLRRLAAELGWPACMEVAHDDQIVAAVLWAGVKVRHWRRFEQSGRRWHQHYRIERNKRAARRAARRRRAGDDLPF